MRYMERRLRSNGGCGGAYDLAAFLFLYEYDDAYVLKLPRGIEAYRRVARVGRRFILVNRGDLAQGTHDGSVMEVGTGILSGRDRGMQPGFGNCQPDFGFVAVLRSGEPFDRDSRLLDNRLS